MRVAYLAAQRSNCCKRAVGATLVQNNRIVSTGYNGTPFGIANCNKGGCKRCNSNAPHAQDLGIDVCLHAEESVLLEAGKSLLFNYYRYEESQRRDTICNDLPMCTLL